VTFQTKSQEARNTTPARHSWDWQRLGFWTLILLGGALRFYALGRYPAGLNSDEASTGVEALSILRTGMDRWGNHLPVWFPAWGSGMNALYSYIAVPVIAGFGLGVVSLRAIGAFFGVLTLPVAYQTARFYFGRDTALLTLALVALLPWHVMASRWALDSNLAPFFFTLGIWAIGKAVRDGGKYWPLLAFLPWAIGTYSYPATLPPAVISTAGILVIFRHRITRSIRAWAAGIVVGFLILLPFLLFLARNQFHLPPYPFESDLPFSIPTLLSSRLAQLHHSVPETIFNNLVFIWGGYRDGAPWHQSVWFAPLTGVAPYLTPIAVLALAMDRWRERKPHVALPNAVLIILASAIVIVTLLPLNLTRFNWFYIPSIMVVSDMIVRLASSKGPLPTGLRLSFAWGSAAYLGVFLALFIPYYFTRYNDELVSLDRDLLNGFRVGIDDALRAEIALAKPDEPVLVEIGTVHPYPYVLFYGLADIETFQATRKFRIENGVYQVTRFGRFYFEPDALPPGRSFVFVGRANALPCEKPETLTTGPLWAVGRCDPNSRQ